MSDPLQIAVAGLLAPTHAQAKALLAQAPQAVPCALAELWRMDCPRAKERRA